MDIRKRKKIRRNESGEDNLQPTAFELEVCKYLYRNMPMHTGRLGGYSVYYFEPGDAVNCLLKSKLASSAPTDKKQKDRILSDAEAAVRFMSKLLEKNLILRAIKVKKKHSVKTGEDVKKSKPRRNIAPKKENFVCGQNGPTVLSEPLVPVKSVKSSKSLAPSPPTNRSKRPPRLEYAMDQCFVLDHDGAIDQENTGESVYVWVYEAPPSFVAWILGLVLIIGVVVCCAFPLWPVQARQCFYYITVVGAGVLCLLIFLMILRVSLFFVWILLSLGRWRFWLFPNFFADCGFWDSFWPLYSLEHVSLPSSSAISPQISDCSNDG